MWVQHQSCGNHSRQATGRTLIESSGQTCKVLSQHPPTHTLFSQPPSTDLHGIVDGEDVPLGATTACADHGANLAEAALAREDVRVGQTEGPQLTHSLMGRGGEGR